MTLAAVVRQCFAAAALMVHGKHSSATALLVVGTTAGGAVLGLDPWLFAIGAACGAIVWGLRPAVPRRVAVGHFAVTVLLAGIAAPGIASSAAGLQGEMPQAGFYTVKFLLALGSHEYLVAIALALGWQPVLPWAWARLTARLAADKPESKT